MFYPKAQKVNGRYKGTKIVRDFSAGMDSVTDEEVLDLPKCAEAYNFSYRGGVLCDGEGIKTAKFGFYDNSPVFNVAGVTPQKLYYYKKYDEDLTKYVEYLLVYGDDNEMYIANAETDSEFTKIKGLTFDYPPKAVPYAYNGEDVMIFSDERSMKIYNGKTVKPATDVPAITSMCIHNERLFVTEAKNKTSLWFSDDFDPMNWKISLDEAGFIDIREGNGSLLKAVSFGGYVYAFASYAIMRITAYGDQREFSLETAALSSGKIYPESITVCGDRIIYLAEDGFYAFTGGTPVKIIKKLDKMLIGTDNSECKGCYFGGKYYCVLRLKTSVANEQIMLVYDVHAGTYCLMRNLSIKDIVLMDGEEHSKLLFLIKDRFDVCTLSKRAELCSVPLTKFWKSGKCDLNIGKEKTITKVSLTASEKVEVLIKSEAGSRLLHFSGINKEQTLPVGLKGRSFIFEIESRVPENRISAFRIEYEYFAEA